MAIQLVLTRYWGLGQRLHAGSTHVPCLQASHHGQLQRAGGTQVREAAIGLLACIRRVAHFLVLDICVHPQSDLTLAFAPLNRVHPLC